MTTTTAFRLGLAAALVAAVAVITDAQSRWKPSVGWIQEAMLFYPDNTYDIGESGDHRPRNIYAGTAVNTTSFVAAAAGLHGWSGRGWLSCSADGICAITENDLTGFTRFNFGGNTAAFSSLIPVVVGSVGHGFILGQADGTGITFATLGAATDGAMVYCTDCTFANPCAGSGTGAIAKRLNGAWRCD